MLLLLLQVIGTLSVVGAVSSFQGLPRSRYCSTLSNPCCDGRIDSCSVPVYGTLCYCDQFCNRTADDCCPDYFSVCLNQAPPQPNTDSRCFAGDRYYQYGQEVTRNCNKCKCQSSGQLVCETNDCLIDQDLVSAVNSNRDLGWSAANYTEFWGRTLQDGVIFRTGTLLPHKSVKRMQPIMIKPSKPTPPNFDARTRWPRLITDPIDQGWCASSWAVSTAGVASDRFGIMTMSHMPVRLSAQHLVNCNKRGQQGCKGGHLSRAWMFIRKLGLVNEECEPWTNGLEHNCRFPRKFNLQSQCQMSRNQHYGTEPFKVGPAYRIQGEQDVMQEIMASGPVQATMQVYQDFFAYKSGIYKKSNSGNRDHFGYHSVRIIGWGEEIDSYGRLVKYWRAVNSWGPYWGENGLFRIVRGTNECMIEEFILAAWTKGLSHMTDMLTPANRESNTLN